ncbi:MAG TPA: hypothetical protein VKP30_11150 [Polyangiaceae bacterium]|nr:hypothetical protein [Polyangiaceae bacterium]
MSTTQNSLVGATVSLETAHHARKVGSRGAAVLEALIVIPVMTLGLYGLLFLREHYLARIGTARLARAAVVAHGMAACRGASAREWIGKDLGSYGMGVSNQQQVPARAESIDASYVPFGSSASSRATHALEKSENATSDGKGVLNPVTDSSVSSRVKVSQRNTSPHAQSRILFESQIQSQSFVSCADEVQDGDYGSIIEMTLDELSSLF